jgi:phospholipid/cholesterol/gamma-HCH transport system substrate-binding protein
MKFKIKYADQIVGILTIGAIVALILVIFLLGSKQRWFAKDYKFTTTFDTASGINVGMPLQYKGFTIGKVKTITLTDDNLVDVSFSVYDTYYNRVKEGSLVELIINPIGLGNQFLFHPGNGKDLIVAGSIIPRVDSPTGKAMIAAGLVTIPKRDDTITNLIAQVSPLLTNLNETLGQVNGAFKGTGKGPLAESMTGAAKTLTNVSGITGDLYASLDTILQNVTQITASLEKLSASISDPKGLVPKLVDPDGKMFNSIEASLKAVQGTLTNVEDSSSILKSQVPQIARLIEDLRVALVKGQDVLEALRNNPILKNGVPERVQNDSSGTNSRNIEF